MEMVTNTGFGFNFGVHQFLFSKADGLGKKKDRKESEKNHHFQPGRSKLFNFFEALRVHQGLIIFIYIIIYLGALEYPGNPWLTLV